jgi:hypothetical protein
MNAQAEANFVAAVMNVARHLLTHRQVSLFFKGGLAHFGVDRKLLVGYEREKIPEIESIYIRQLVDQLKAGPERTLLQQLEECLKDLIPNFVKEQNLELVPPAHKTTKLIKLLDRPIAIVRQEAVGHGGFHNGVLASDKPYVRWIYDCGAWRKSGKEKLASRVRRFASRARKDGRPVDLLFLSHFDADHVNGLELLFAEGVRVDTVVLPYLSPAEAFAVLAGQVASERWSKSLVEHVLEPAAWFGSRGARRVVRLRGGPPPEGEGAAPVPEGPTEDLSEDHPFRPVFLGPDGRILKRKKRGGRAQEIVARPGTSIGVGLWNGGYADWWFLPYVHPISDLERRRLTKAAESFTRCKVSDRAFGQKLASALQSSSNRRAVKAMYRGKELGNANAISLSLYIGPRMAFSDRVIMHSNIPRTSTDKLGWLLTGDAELRNCDRRDEWLKFLKRKQSLPIGTLMLPHHGSVENFHVDILNAAPEARLFVTADAGDPLRPHVDVRADIAKSRGANAKIITVATRGLEEISAPSGLPYDIRQYAARW